jgi:hypothetical protein
MALCKDLNDQFKERMAQTHPASDLQGKFQEWQAPEKVSKQRMF